MKNNIDLDLVDASFGDPLAQLEARYFGLLEAAPDAMVVVDEGGQIVLFNLRAEIQFGYPRDELLGHPVTTIIPNGFAERLVADSLRTTAEALNQQIGTGIELIGRRRDGSEFPIEIMLSPLLTAESLLVTAAIRDISQRRKSENKIIYLNRIYATLSSINALIVRVRAHDELFREACSLAVATGGFCKAWIGIVDPAGKELVLVASAAANSKPISILNDSYMLDERAPLGGSLVVRAVREGKAMFSNSAQTDNALVFVGDQAAAEINSAAVLPLVVAGKVAGMFALYSTEANFFDEVELKLLVELADDISYAMLNIDKQDQLNYLAYHDSLTGLANERLFLDRVSTHIASARRGSYRFALYLFDLDGFKDINDSLGQAAGDSLLQQVTDWLICHTGDVNLVARIGADQFAIVVPAIREDGEVARLVKKLLSEFMEQVFPVGDAELRVAAKIGITLFPQDGVVAEDLFKKSEAVLKRAKADGDRFLFYEREMTDKVASGLALENQLRNALDEGQFVLHYQPIIHLSSGAISGAEALIRWNHPEVGLMSPDSFIPILEETGMIHEVGRWVLRTAIGDYMRWCALGFSDIRIAVNVSQVQLRAPGFLAEIRQLLGHEAKAASGLELELTEGLMMLDIDENIKTLSAIRDLGVRVSIDDFGTGFSSLSHLTRLPLDTLKVDRTFIKNMTATPEDYVLVAAIVSLANLLGFNVLAEGVETQEQSESLRLLNCNEVQGFLFSKPLPVDAFEAKLLSADRGAAQDLSETVSTSSLVT